MSGNKTRTQELWDSIKIEPGFVALENQFAKSKHLPDAQRFPWDSNKSVYVLQAYHDMHCLVSNYSCLLQKLKIVWSGYSLFS